MGPADLAETNEPNLIELSHRIFFFRKNKKNSSLEKDEKKNEENKYLKILILIFL